MCLSVGQVLPVAVLSAGATIGPYAWEGHKEDPSFPGELLELPSRQANMHEIFCLSTMIRLKLNSAEEQETLSSLCPY